MGHAVAKKPQRTTLVFAQTLNHDYNLFRSTIKEGG